MRHLILILVTISVIYGGEADERFSKLCQILKIPGKESRIANWIREGRGKKFPKHLADAAYDSVPKIPVATLYEWAFSAKYALDGNKDRDVAQGVAKAMSEGFLAQYDAETEKAKKTMAAAGEKFSDWKEPRESFLRDFRNTWWPVQVQIRGRIQSAYSRRLSMYHPAGFGVMDMSVRRAKDMLINAVVEPTSESEADVYLTGKVEGVSEFRILTHPPVVDEQLIIVRVINKLFADQDTYTVPAWLELIPGCIREGFDDPDKLLVFWSHRRSQGLYPS